MLLIDFIIIHCWEIQSKSHSASQLALALVLNGRMEQLIPMQFCLYNYDLIKDFGRR